MWSDNFEFSTVTGELEKETPRRYKNDANLTYLVKEQN